MQEVLDFLKKAGVYYLATVDGDQARVRPFGTANIFDGKLYIQTGKKKACAQQMAAKPKIEICAMHEGSWIRITAKAVTDDRREAKVSMLDAYPNLKEKYSADDDNTNVLYLQDVTANYFPSDGEPKVYKF